MGNARSSRRVLDGTSLEPLVEVVPTPPLRDLRLSSIPDRDGDGMADLVLAGIAAEEGVPQAVVQVLGSRSLRPRVAWELPRWMSAAASPVPAEGAPAGMARLAFVGRDRVHAAYAVLLVDLDSGALVRRRLLEARFSYPAVGVASIPRWGAAQQKMAIAVGGLLWDDAPAHSVRMFDAATLELLGAITHERAGLAFGSSLAYDGTRPDRSRLLIGEADAAVQAGGSLGAFFVLAIDTGVCHEVLRSEYPDLRKVGASVAVLPRLDAKRGADWLVGCTLRDCGGASEGFVLRICGDTGLLLGRYP